MAAKATKLDNRPLFEKILRAGEGRTFRRLEKAVASVNALEEEYKELTDEDLLITTIELKERYRDGESLDDLLPEAFAAVREAASRTLGMRHFDVQVMGGAALHYGNIAEMKTGEGKTLVATLPAYLNALAGQGVHVVTVNDFLASYQSELMSRVFRALGMTTGVILSGQSATERAAQYQADITYGTNNEFGFDYLRDNMALDRNAIAQRGHFYAIVDEADSILIDEARTPLIISGVADGEAVHWFAEFAKVALQLEADRDYEVDEKKHTVGILEPGIDKVEKLLGIDNLYESANTPLISFLNNSLRAKSLYRRDKDYVVVNGEVNIVDEHTGRVLAGRRYAEGLHQAIEAKEGVKVQAENETFATVTLQNYFRMYKKLSGMTGTAETEAAELMSTYKLGVVPIPTNKPMQRIDQPDLIYRTEEAKLGQVVQDIVERNRTGQPILVGTTSVEKSEQLSKLLAKRGVRHEVLNAKNNTREAVIVAQAGRFGAVTVATNMAGRGTDIMLGGNSEFLAVAEMESRGLRASENPEEYEKVWPEVYAETKAVTEKDAVRVSDAGGLYVLGTERHENRRIDNQLRGRSGRQGDRGESRFYLALTDDLMRLFGKNLSNMTALGLAEDVPIESKFVSRAIRSAQGQMEGANAETRKNLLKYDDVLNLQREAVYGDRRQILEGDDIHDRVETFIDSAIGAIIDSSAPESDSGDWNMETLWAELGILYPISLTIEEVEEEARSGARRGGLNKDFLKTEILSDAKVEYQKKEDALGSEVMRDLERQIVLTTYDRNWRAHLYEMDYLKSGIQLRAMAQKDPLLEYRREGFALFQTMTGNIREEAVGSLFHAELATEQELQATGAPIPLIFSAPNEDGGVEVERQAGPAKPAGKRGAFGQKLGG